MSEQSQTPVEDTQAQEAETPTAPAAAPPAPAPDYTDRLEAAYYKHLLKEHLPDIDWENERQYAHGLSVNDKGEIQGKVLYRKQAQPAPVPTAPAPRATVQERHSAQQPGGEEWGDARRSKAKDMLQRLGFTQ